MNSAEFFGHVALPRRSTVSPADLIRTHSFRASLERLRIAQLREGSRYCNLRTLVPVLAMGVAWVWVNSFTRSTSVQELFSRSVSVRHLLLAVAISTLWNVWLSLSIFRRISIRTDLKDEARRLFTASIVCGAVLFAANLLRGELRQGLVLELLLTAGLLSISTLLLGVFLIGAAISPVMLRPRVALIVGSGGRADMLRASLEKHYAPFRIFGCLDDQYHGANRLVDNYLGDLSLLPDLLKTYPIEVVLIGLPMKSKYAEIQQTIETCELIGVESHYMQDIFKTSRAHIEPHSQEPSRFAVLSSVRPDPTFVVKRVLDVVLASLILLFVSPIMILAALAVRFTSPGPILFVQQRYGLNRQRFPMFKFRSMVVDAEQRQATLETQNEAQGPVFKLKADPRITRVGAFLRRTSIDELPQLFNVLRGEMSLVGPRPLPLRDVFRFEEPWLLRRFSVRPGLTCLWQVTGRSNTSFDYWISQDLAYIDTWSLGLDLKILLMTVPAVLKGSGAV